MHQSRLKTNTKVIYLIHTMHFYIQNSIYITFQNKKKKDYMHHLSYGPETRNLNFLSTYAEFKIPIPKVSRHNSESNMH